jgi:dephospho-CoA kinase
VHVLGLTGGIGSGKSTVTRRLAARGLPVVDGDDLSRALTAPGAPAIAEILAAFGPEILTPNGGLSRSRLAEIVFADPAARQRLERIVHPRVRALAKQRLGEHRAHGEPLACYAAPLLIEVGLADEYRPLVVVTASEATQIARAATRDGVDPEAVRARLVTQMPLSEKAMLADYVIDNDGPLDQTLAQADRVLEDICGVLGIDPRRYPRPV